jgi:hypothetical protein
MKLAVLGLALAVALGYAFGGRLSNLSELSVRWAPVAFLGLLMQVIVPPGGWPLILLLASFVVLAAFTVANLRVTGFVVILVGLALNFAVIAVNGGMPVSREALVASGQADTVDALLDGRGAKHHLAAPDDRLVFLGDVIPIPGPVHQAISVGDLFTYGGVAIVVAAAMRRRASRPRLAAEVGRVGA